MKLTSSFIFLIVLIAGGFCENTTTEATTEATTTSVQTTVTDTTTTTSTTEQPDTTSTTVSTTTVPSTTSSTEPTSTTIVSTTTSSPNTTTTPKPTTVPPVTTTKSPEPPTPVDGSWNVTEGNLTCIRVDLRARFAVSIKDHIEYIVINPNATSTGNCKLSDTLQEFQLEDSEYTLRMIFEKDSSYVYLENVTFTYTLPTGAGFVFNDTKLFNVKAGNSYNCESSSNIDLKNVTMEVFHIHIQAFGRVEDKDFGTAEECAADNKVNDIVPIAVGIALLVLVVIVLVAYFVGRRRSRQKGYQSV